ncbi:MAG: Ca2+/H+ antiporter, family [Petroclostridium sp.]|jgi:putative Ca2+/H+ antiporter (TMEM165/GDT1 family)|uniref:TMEM165/GDT1 family protein n=1 Tax=Petroclostridium xylanilyticum TaxID=1792311 RepID=UPI000B99A4CC|nr:TMEM165/GDT1 family protein [Petroclostridium xylanilyticum]MDK2810455.1 Ca2+/H+ antiporter, family [Petroclostridium sp.]
MVQELIKAFFFIFMAEMGDKTQILAMAFATKYKVQKVLLGVLIGSFLNHGVAVLLGVYMSSIIPINAVRFIAACAFILFGLWTLKAEDDEGEESAQEKFGPVVTVALAFFIGELGDKTQLAAITLSTTAQYPLFILGGTVLGMVVTSSVGIFVGSKLGKRIPELTMKLISGGIFIFFGILGLFETTPKQYVTSFNITVFFIILAAIIFILLRPSIYAMRCGEISAFKRTASELYEHMRKMSETVEDICLGEHQCGKCLGKNCMIGLLKNAMKVVNEKGIYVFPEDWNAITNTVEKKYDLDKVIEGLAMSVIISDKFNKAEDENFIANKARETFELICFKQKLPFNGDIKEYFSLLTKKDKQLGEKVINKFNQFCEMGFC